MWGAAPFSCACLAALSAACSPSPADSARTEIPRLPDPPADAGLDVLLAERLESALVECRRERPGALLELAKTYQANGLAELAARAYRLCLERGGAEAGDPARIAFHLATSLELDGRSDEAVEMFLEAQRLAPDYAPAFWRAGNLLIEQGRAGEARRAFERALALEPEGVPQTLGLARVWLFEGEAAAALAVLEPLSRKCPRERFTHGLLARARRALGDDGGARAALQAEERALVTSWNDPWTAEVEERAAGIQAVLKRANRRLLAGDARAALALLEPAHARCPDDLALQLLLIKARIEGGESGRAAALIAFARTRHAGVFKLDYYAGLVALERKDLPRARRELESARELNPAFGPIHAALGEVELRNGALAAAESAFERALEQGEDALRTRILFAQVEIQLGKHARARGLLEEACADFPASAVPLAHLAEVQARLGDAQAARARLAEAERIDPSFAYLAKVRDLVARVESGGR